MYGRVGTHADDERGEHHPAHLPPDAGPVANHLLDVVVELVHTCETKINLRVKNIHIRFISI